MEIYKEKFATIKENVPKVYDAGYQKGKSEGSGADTLELLLTNSLTTYRNDTLKQLKASLFQDNSNIISLFLPKVVETHTSIFRNCKSLQEIDLSSTIDIASSCFFGCVALEKADFPKVTSIYADAFKGAGIKHLILRSTTFCVLKATSAFYSTPIESGTGYIYVPRALIEEYKAATNWVTYAAQFRALEDYTIDGTITSAFDESRI
jgi:hypothetical protein